MDMTVKRHFLNNAQRARTQNKHSLYFEGQKEPSKKTFFYSVRHAGFSTLLFYIPYVMYDF
jgi:hypothetical protein